MRRAFYLYGGQIRDANQGSDNSAGTPNGMHEVHPLSSVSHSVPSISSSTRKKFFDRS